MTELEQGIIEILSKERCLSYTNLKSKFRSCCFYTVFDSLDFHQSLENLINRGFVKTKDLPRKRVQVIGYYTPSMKELI